MLARQAEGVGRLELRCHAPAAVVGPCEALAAAKKTRVPHKNVLAPELFRGFFDGQ